MEKEKIMKSPINDLTLKLKSLKSQENKVLKEILILISEIDKKKNLFRTWYPSLFAYLVEEIKYEGGCASKEIAPQDS